MDVNTEWFQLGLALGLREPTLKEIDQDKRSIEERKREMLAQWLNQVDNSKPTNVSLEAALIKPTVKCRAVADKVHKHYTK